MQPTKDSVFKLFSSVRLVQEVSRSTTSSSTSRSSSTCSPNQHNNSGALFAEHLMPINVSTSASPIPSPSSFIDHHHQQIPLQYDEAIDTSSSSLSTCTKPKTSNAQYGYSGTRRNMTFNSVRSPSYSKVLHDNDPQQTNANNSQDSIKLKSKKSQKLLCLWPLPILTRSTIFLSVLVSALNASHLIQLTCSSPKLVLFRWELINLIMSPFLFDFTLQGVILFGWNILILGLFEESLSSPLGGPRPFTRILTSITLAVCSLRQGLGFVFSRSTGWALPALFFSDSMHECNQGLAPFLFALLIIQSASIDDKYILIFGTDEDSNYKLTIRKVYLQLIMLLVNYTVKNILWWSLTGVLVGYLATMWIQVTYMVRPDDGYYYLTHPSEDQEQGSTPNEKAKDTISWNGLMDPYRRTPIWRILWSAVKRGTIVILITLPLLFTFNAYYTRETYVDESVLNKLLNTNDYLFSFVIMTAPRRGNPTFLTETLQSYLDTWPLLNNVDSARPDLYDRIQLFVYTHFSNHSEYDRAYDKFSIDPKGQQYVKWIRESGDVWDHRLHISSALKHALSNGSSTYVALLEDDFPICDRHAWREIENVVYKATLQAPDHCGLFVGTGGSGLFLKPDIATLVSRLLLEYTEMPPDIIIQKCLRGELPECHFCSQTLVASKELLMHHIGFNTSTSIDRKYKKNEFQCGWRHPFNGDPDVITI